MGKFMTNARRYVGGFIGKAKEVVKKHGGKVVAAVCGAVTAGQLLISKAYATAPASLADALAVEIDQSIVWTAMSVMIGIIGGIAAYYFVKRLMGSR